ncbi:MAG: hypothetical protein IJD68_00540 [Ruminococcus sp.]|nr:hypothetical protein [Ruminococcus sp.]
MTIASKVLIILTMIAGFWLIFPLVLGIIALKKINTNTMTTGWAVVVLLFVNTIAGILLLCDKSTYAQEA